jgi:hypothetical protein
VNMDVSRYLHGGVNVTGFQLVKMDSDIVKNFTKIWRRVDRHKFPGAGEDRLRVSPYNRMLLAHVHDVAILYITSCYIV